jgi:hypothetical protein
MKHQNAQMPNVSYVSHSPQPLGKGKKNNLMVHGFSNGAPNSQNELNGSMNSLKL